MVGDVNHDVTHHQHADVIIGHPFPKKALCQEAYPTYTSTLVTTYCATFDIRACEVEDLEIGLVLHSADLA